MKKYRDKLKSGDASVAKELDRVLRVLSLAADAEKAIYLARALRSYIAEQIDRQRFLTFIAVIHGLFLEDLLALIELYEKDVAEKSEDGYAILSEDECSIRLSSLGLLYLQMGTRLRDLKNGSTYYKITQLGKSFTEQILFADK